MNEKLMSLVEIGCPKCGNKKYKYSKVCRKCLDFKGENNPFYGKHHTEETKIKIVQTNTQRGTYKENSEKMKRNNPMKNLAIKEKIINALKGRKSPMLGKHHTEHSNQKNREKHLGKFKGKTYEERYGEERAKDIKEKLSKSAIKRIRSSLSEKHKGNISKSLKGNPKIIERQKNLWKDEEYYKMMSNSAKRKWRNPEYREKQINAVLNSLLKRPTSYEQKIANLCVEKNLPFVYTGNGTFLIGFQNPDFINEKRKIVIEVYHTYFKIRDFGSCEKYEQQRAEHFAKYGWKTIFIRTEEIENKKWKEICLNKIK